MVHRSRQLIMASESSYDMAMQPLLPLQRWVAYTKAELQQVREDLQRVHSFHETRESELHARFSHVLNNTTDLRQQIQDLQKDHQDLKKEFQILKDKTDQQGQLIRQLLSELADIKNMSADTLATQPIEE